MRIAWIIGAAGLVASIVGAILQPSSFAFAWLAALSVWIRWPLGCLALLLVHALTGGRWGNPVRPGFVQGIRILPLLLPAVIPLLFFLPDLYPWLRKYEPREVLLERRKGMWEVQLPSVTALTIESEPESRCE